MKNILGSISRLILLTALFSASLHAAPDRPNILLIMVDDLKPAMASYGDPYAITPNLDRLAARGTSFDRAYANQAVCAPSRFNLMLGSHSTSTGLYHLSHGLRDAVPDAITLPQYFSQHGYETQSLGKVYHIGHGNQGDPQSFDRPHFEDKVVEYVLPESTDGGQLTREEGYFSNQGARDETGKLRPRGAAWEAPDVDDEAYADGRVAAEAIRRLEAARQSDKPFFMAVGFARPHLPFTAPKRYWDLYDPADFKLPEITTRPQGAPDFAHKRGGEISAYKPVPENWDGNDPELARQLTHGYYASTSYMDAQVGKVLDALDHLELADNTIIVLWGDHGFHLGELGIWTKHVNYETATRIPLVFVAPGVTPPGSRSRAFAETVDIYPTLAALAGLPKPEVPQPIDGESLAGVLEAPDSSGPDHAYHCFPRGGHLGQAIRTEQYRLVRWTPLTKGPDGQTGPPVYELYDYSQGPVETVNLARDLPEIVAKLERQMDSYPRPVDAN